MDHLNSLFQQPFAFGERQNVSVESYIIGELRDLNKFSESICNIGNVDEVEKWTQDAAHAKRG